MCSSIIHNTNKEGRLFVVSAPSGAGKTTLVNEVVRRRGDSCSLARVVTYTTKPARQGEDRQGIDYHFLTCQEFEAKIAEGFFLEWSGAYGHYYGSPRSVLDEIAQGFSRILIIDRAGARQVKERYASAVLVWVYIRDMAVLQARLLRRGTDSADQIARRLALACEEIEQEQSAPFYEHYVLNEAISKAVGDFELV
ncbi:hypothetical protein, partial [Methylicorpusculum sp.]|uniref:guanylate kinase n=1 Tax=Methylicorpusculum sp. TaxID=2713644 RepID=UPI002ABCC19B